MVYYSKYSLVDLNEIFVGLLTWEKHQLEYSHVVSYMNDLKNMCTSLDRYSYHAPSTYTKHKKLGQFVYRYRRNKNTTWYIIYNKDEYNNVFIQRILSNYSLENSDQ